MAGEGLTHFPYACIILFPPILPQCPSCKEPVSDEALEIILPSELFSKYDKFRFERALQNDKDFNRLGSHPPVMVH